MNKTKIVTAVVMLVIFLTNCNYNGDNDTNITIWAMGAEAEYLNKLIPKFEKSNPGIKISVQQIPWTAAQEKLITAFASDNTPDICQLGNTWVPQFASLNAIEPLDSLLNKSGTINKENYFEGIWDTNIIEGKLFGIPWYIDTRVLFYRKDVIEKAGYSSPPKTWEELTDLSEKIKTLHGDSKKYSIYLPTNEWAPFIIFGMQAGSELLAQNSTYGNFAGENFKRAFNFIINFHKNKLAPIGISEVTNVYQAFKDEYFSIYISGPWNINEFKKWMTGDLKDKWMTAPLPGPDKDTPGISLAGGSSLVIFKNSKHKNEVWKFIEYLSEPETQIEFYKLLNDLPAVKKAWEDSLLMNDKYVQAFYKQFFNVVPTPKIPEWEHIVFSKLQQYAEAAARETMSVDSALAMLDKDVNRILEKRRWLLTNKNLQ
jgi:multiple sugar transport system substrate-binding protein